MKTTKNYSPNTKLSSRRPRFERLPHLGQQSLDSSGVSECKGKCLNLLQSIDKLCDSYEQLPVIEFEEDEEPVIETSRIEKSPQKVNVDSKLSFIIAQLNKRIKEYIPGKAVYPSSSRFKVFSGTEEKVGPGSYKAAVTNQLECHEFSNIPRLFTPIAHTMRTIESLYKHKSIIADEKIIEKNKLNAIDPKYLKSHFTQNFGALKAKEKYVKEKKEQIDQLTKAEKKEKLDEKIRKFEWRMTKEEVAIAQKTWAIFAVIVGMRTVLANRTRIKRILRIKWGRILKKFTLLARCIGKFLRKLRKIRKKILTKRLRFFETTLNDFVKKDIIQKKKIINISIERTRDVPVIIHLMAKWKKSIVIIQANSRNMKKVHQARRFALNLMWEKLSESMQKAKIQEKIHRTAVNERLFLMPILIKNKFLKKFIRKVLLQYAKQSQIYAQAKKSIKLATDPEKIALIANSIKKPVLSIFNRKSLMIEYIEMANSYKVKLEKKQREIKYSILSLSDLAKSPTKLFK